MRRPFSILLVFLLLFPGCVQDQRTVALTHELDTDRDRALEWLRVSFKSGDHLPALARELTFTATGPGGTQTVPACQSTHLEGDGCQNPLASTETVAAGTTLYLPCPREGHHTFEVQFEDGPTLRHGMPCGEAA